jgi:hypothetical protein
MQDVATDKAGNIYCRRCHQKLTEDQVHPKTLEKIKNKKR